MNIGELLADARALLAEATISRLESELLLGHVLSVSRAHLYANPRSVTSARQGAAFHQLVQRRRRGEPIAYLTGRREFWSLALKVTPDVLIPRPETELLVEASLDLIPVAAQRRLVDLATGCGARPSPTSRLRKRAGLACGSLDVDWGGAAFKTGVHEVSGEIDLHNPVTLHLSMPVEVTATMTGREAWKQEQLVAGEVG